MGFLRYFIDIGKTVTKTSILFIVGEFVKKQLDALIKREIIVDAIKLGLFLLAVLVSLVKGNVSLYISSLFITGLFIHTAITIIPWMITSIP
jgi:fucose permease